MKLWNVFLIGLIILCLPIILFIGMCLANHEITQIFTRFLC